MARLVSPSKLAHMTMRAVLALIHLALRRVLLLRRLFASAGDAAAAPQQQAQARGAYGSELTGARGGTWMAKGSVSVYVRRDHVHACGVTAWIRRRGRWSCSPALVRSATQAAAAPSDSSRASATPAKAPSLATFSC